MRSRLYACLVGLAGAVLLAACSIVESERISLDVLDGSQGCSSSLGWYALPKSYVRVRVAKIQDAPLRYDLLVESPASNNANADVDVVSHPDPALTFCLDYLQSITSGDTISVRKWPFGKDLTKNEVDANTTTYLGALLVNATDQTVQLAKYMSRIAFILSSGNPSFPGRSTEAKGRTALLDLEFDPFDDRETARINATLSGYGFCLLFEDYTVALPEGADRGRAIDRYCNAPAAAALASTPVAARYREIVSTPVDPKVRGIYYRPRADYRLSVYRKPDPRGAGSWTLRSTQTVSMENLSPVLALAVHRAAFAGKRINIIFDRGMPLTACIAKSSEIAEAVNIPLEVARGIVDLPGQILSIRINRDENQRKLLAAQTLLANVLHNKELIKKNNGVAPTTGLNGATGSPTQNPIDHVSYGGDAPGIVPTASVEDFTTIAFGEIGSVSISSICKGS